MNNEESQAGVEALKGAIEALRKSRDWMLTEQAIRHYGPNFMEEVNDAITALESMVGGAKPASYQRRFRGPGHLEETGYIPAGSATEREAAASIGASMKEQA